MSIHPGKFDPIKPDIELFDYKSKKRYGLKLAGDNALQIGTISQDDSVHIRAAGKRVGDFDEQRSWKAGRGIENLSDNAEGYWDGKDIWTLTPGHAHQTLLWRFARGLQHTFDFLPDKTHSLTWKSVIGTYITNSFTPRGTAEVLSTDNVRLWIRKVGTPGTLRLTVSQNNAGVPGTVLATVDITASALSDTTSALYNFASSTGSSMTNPNLHWVTVHDQSGVHNKNNHWEVGVYQGGTTGLVSSDGSNWSAAGFDLYFYIAGLHIKQRFWSFFLDEAMYIVNSEDLGLNNSKLWINGDRGKCTVTGQTGKVGDSSKNWRTDMWKGAWVKLIRGTGAGQTREITSNNSTNIFFGTLDVAVDTTSEYIIYASDEFTEIASTGLGVVTSQPCVVNQIVYFPQGSGTNIRTMIWNNSTAAHAFGADGTNKASFMISSAGADGIQVWRTLNDFAIGANKTVSFAPAAAWATSPAALVFGTAKNVGDSTAPITGMCEKDGIIYVFKNDSTWFTNNTFSLTKVQNGMEKTPSIFNGIASISHDKFLIFSWLHSAIRAYGSSFDDIGQDWSGFGLPNSREGYFSSFDSYTSLLIAAVDAGTGTSSVLGFDGLGWHEILRAYDANYRIRMVKMQPNEGTRNRLWIDCGGDLIFQEFPFQKASPRLDTGVRYMHEAVVESSAIDMGTASSLAKFIKELTIYCENLGGSNQIDVDYQIDNDVQTANWTPASTLYESPEAITFLGLSNIRKFSYRLRIQSSDNTKPVDVIGVIPNGYARAPYKMVWTLRCKADNITSRGRLVKPDILMRWLLDNARFPGRLEMQSQYELAHKFFVIVHPPRMFPYKPAQNGQAEESILTLVLEEA